MLTLMICFLVLAVLFFVGIVLTGAIVGALIWMIKLPVAVIMFVIGAVCCCTIILIPVGLILFRTGGAILI